MHLTVMSADDTSHDRQSESGARVLSDTVQSLKRSKDPLNMLFSETDPIVIDADDPVRLQTFLHLSGS